MTVCPNAQQCSLHPMLEMRSLRVLKTDYCERDFERCERYRRHRERRIVPMNLLPDGKTLGAAGPEAGPPEPRRRA
jgi:hypothetical protein